MKNDLLFLKTRVFPIVSADLSPPPPHQQGRGQPGRQRHQWQFYQHAEHATVLGKSENKLKISLKLSFVLNLYKDSRHQFSSKKQQYKYGLIPESRSFKCNTLSTCAETECYMEYYCYVSSKRSSKQVLTVLTSFLLSCHRVPKDKSYSSMLRVPSEGLELKTRIYVEVKASNLTDKYATPTVA